jgi:hypothetical protein
MSIVGVLVGLLAYFGWLWSAGYNLVQQFSFYDMYAQYLNLGPTLTTLPPPSGLLDFGYGQKTIVLSVVLVVVAAAFIFVKWPRNTSPFEGALLSLLLFLALANWQPQYVLWLLPLATLDFALNRRSVKYLTLTVAVALFLALGVFINPPSSYFGNLATGSSFIYLFSDLPLGLAKLTFALTCLAYSGRIVEDRTSIFFSRFGRIDLTGAMKETLRTKFQAAKRGMLHRKSADQPAVA